MRSCYILSYKREEAEYRERGRRRGRAVVSVASSSRSSFSSAERRKGGYRYIGIDSGRNTSKDGQLEDRR